MINRRARRVRMSCRLIFMGLPNIQGEAQTIDLSTSGCRAFCDTPPPIGTKLKVAVYLKGRAQPLRIEWAAVQWVRHTMIGLRFCYVQRTHLAHLRTVLVNAPYGNSWTIGPQQSLATKKLVRT